jgi:hypothetical protein
MDCSTPQAMASIREEMPPERREEIRPLPRQEPREEMPPPLLSSRMFRILEAVGWKHVPRGLDYDALEKDIEASIGHYRVVVELQSEKARRDEIRRLNQIIKTGKQFADILNEPGDGLSDQEDDELRELLKYWIHRRESKVSDLEYEISLGPEWYQQIKKPGRNGVPEYQMFRVLWSDLVYQNQHRSPFEWLVGYFLPKIFETHFGRKPTFTANGAYAHFAAAVLKEFDINGKPYARSTIVREANRVSRNRVRPRKKLSRT